jgi:hypothetical protein
MEAPPGFEPGVEVLQCGGTVSKQAHIRRLTSNSYALDVMEIDGLPSFLMVTTTISTTHISCDLRPRQTLSLLGSRLGESAPTQRRIILAKDNRTAFFCVGQSGPASKGIRRHELEPKHFGDP